MLVPADWLTFFVVLVFLMWAMSRPESRRSR
jgi:hypothetical protein